jgi:hypothetical protein
MKQLVAKLKDNPVGELIALMQQVVTIQTSQHQDFSRQISDVKALIANLHRTT